jgi:hypothetical protein
MISHPHDRRLCAARTHTGPHRIRAVQTNYLVRAPPVATRPFKALRMQLLRSPGRRSDWLLS